MNNSQQIQTRLLCKFSKMMYKRLQEKKYGISSCKGDYSLDNLRDIYDYVQLVDYHLKGCEPDKSCDFSLILENSNYL